MARQKRSETNQARVLVVDDEQVIRDGCAEVLSRMGADVFSTGDAAEGLQKVLTGGYDVILLDIRMPKMSGMDILRKITADHSIGTRVIMITGYGSIPLSVEAMKAGAFDFLSKPFSAQELRRAVTNALEQTDEKPSTEEFDRIIGNSDYIAELKQTIYRIAQTDSTVLLTGESGTGKELVAQTIHDLSKRKDKPFVACDCSALVENLMESELFGHVKGAFSGATESRVGRFQAADRGTLFLDEISNISLAIQAKLLRVIQEQEVPRVGTSQPVKVDVRIIAATNRDIRKEVDEGRFREDLFYRLSVVPVEIKPLREHKKDIMPIADYYFEIYRKRHRSKVKRLSEEAQKSLVSYSWPGNIRELKNTIERLCVLCDNETVDQSDILYYGQDGDAKAPVVDMTSGRMTLVDVERKHIEKALVHFNYQMSKTAEFLGIDRKTLRTKIKNYGIEIKK